MLRPRAALDATFIVASRALVSLLCLASGFRAISDDDYSRVTIAARFAHHPSPDPSGTSWLPLPFWLYGLPMSLLGDSLTTARVTAVALGCLSSLVVWQAAKWLGLGERGALLGALATVALPYGAWLSAATVPEAPTAALLLLGAVTLAHEEPRVRIWGGLALGAACFCRYEAWPVAVVGGLLNIYEGLRDRRRLLLLAGAFALGPIALWLLHGAVRHHDAFFFVGRVRGYRAALGLDEASIGVRLLQTPLALFRFEPELIGLSVVAFGLAAWQRSLRFTRAAWKPAAALGALVLFLISADVSGGAATHHPERSLLPVFWFLALVTAGLVVQLALGQRPWRLPVLGIPVVLGASLLLRPPLLRTFGDRREEELIGHSLRWLGADKVVIDTPDYGYFAVQAALGYGKSAPLAERDPRRPDPPAPASSHELAARLERLGAHWLVTSNDRRALAEPLGDVRLTTPRLAVVELRHSYK